MDDKKLVLTIYPLPLKLDQQFIPNNHVKINRVAGLLVPT